MASSKRSDRAAVNDATVPPKLRTILCEQLGCDEPEITREARLVDDLGADSLDLVEIAMTLEEAHGLDHMLEEFGADAWTEGTVGDVIATLEKAGVAIGA